LVADTIVFSSTAGAAEHQGSRLGEFVRAGEYNGRPFYKQRDTEGRENTFLFSEGGIWVVGQSLGGPTAMLANVQDTDLPPRANWLYVHGTDGNRSWRNNDQTLKLEYTTLSSPCRLVRVAGSGSVLSAQWNTMGIYRLQEGRWSSGRPVYKKGSGSNTMFLLVKEGKCLWSIKDSTTSEMAYIQSGRATNSPTSSRAGGSVRYGRANWTYVNWGRWNEGEISVTCF